MVRFLAMIIVLVGCNGGAKPTASLAELSSDEYDVLSSYTAGKFSSQQGKEAIGKGLSLVILNTTSNDDYPSMDPNGKPIPGQRRAESLRGKAPALQQATIDAFRRVNAQQALLRRSFRFPLSYELVDSTQIASMFSKNGGGWPAYYKLFPHSNGILTFSRIGFSADGTQAFFYWSNRCGGLCGSGNYVIMEKRSGQWEITSEIEAWVS
jgi:hypothetical protein